MQLNNDFAPVVKSSKQMETATASIEMTPHMFQILSVGIYEHPERACIRETSCNAYDTMVEAGTADKPFKVHLPSDLEPYYEVRDFGMGMTHEQVMKLYLTYGASTKRDSNDLIGGLGIGSKSPFAIAQSFTVTSYKDGTVRRYSVYMEEGIPQVTKLTESATTEPNGVAVRVAVATAKIPVFLREAARIYTHFPVKPETNIDIAGSYDGLSVLTEEKGVFKIFSGQNNTRTIKTGIVMGNIEYPVDITDIVSDFDKVIPSFLRQNIASALIYLPIGSVNIAASRESLQLTDATKQVIVDIFAKVGKEILTSFQVKIDSCKTLYETIQTFFESVGDSKIANHTTMLKNLTWGGKTLLEWVTEQDESRTRDEIDPVTGNVRLDYYNKTKKEYIYPAITGYRIWAVRTKSEKRLESTAYNNANFFSLFRDMAGNKLSEQMAFVIDDRYQKNGALKAVGRGVILKAIADKWHGEEGTLADGIMLMFESQAEIDQLATLHHYPKELMRVYKTSDFESAYVPRKVVRGQVKLWMCQGGSLKEVKVDLESLDNPQYYVKAEGSTLSSETLRQSNGLDGTMQALEELLGAHVYMFRKTVWNKIPEDWIELTDKVVEEAVRDNPSLYIDLNRNVVSSTAYNKRPALEKMNVMARMRFNNKMVRDGYVYEKGVKGDMSMGINFEDNLDIMDALFGRPSYSFADIVLPDARYGRCLLEKIVDILPSGCKLSKQIEKAKTRAKVRTIEIRKISREKNKLLTWIDWSKVTLRQVAEHLGYNPTPYIDKAGQ